MISSMTQNKGIGMTEAEWDGIVRKNVQKEKYELKKAQEMLLK